MIGEGSVVTEELDVVGSKGQYDVVSIQGS